ncbi:MAG: 2-oxo acid dehydrogenase subunit E2, partial [Anaerolineales bacterium]|nr:2-oxo acid dehydrogenase subunit E2 [Anaerolineales bacterium]
TKFLVPRLGEGVDEVTIVKWLKREGEPVKELEPLVEVETDKVVTEIPSPASGVLLKIEIAENTPARVGEVMAWIGEAGEAVVSDQSPVFSGQSSVVSGGMDSAPEEAVSKVEGRGLAEEAAIHGLSSTDIAQPSAVSGPPSAISGQLGFLSPVVRKIAAEHGIDLSQVRGTGLGGRITKQDVLQFLENREQRGESSRQSPVVSQPSTVNGLPSVPAGEQFIRHSPIRKQIAERMLASKRISPHVLTVMEADMSRVIAHRAAHKAEFARQGVNLTFTAYFIAAIAEALKANPLVNSTWTDEGLILHRDINIGMAVALGEDGLIVPVIKQADHLSLLGIARLVNDLAERARTKRLQPDEVKGATFTLTNPGTAGSLFAMPIINQPQCGILGTGAIHKRPVVVTDAEGHDAIAIRSMVYLSFVFDHRILDGSGADAFLGKVKQVLEEWK